MSNDSIKLIVANSILKSMNGSFSKQAIHDMARAIATSDFILPRSVEPTNSQLIVRNVDRSVMFAPRSVNVGSLTVSIISSLVASLGVANNITMVTAGGLIATLASAISAYTVTLNSQETAYLYELSLAGPGWHDAQLITNKINSNLPPLHQIAGNGYSLAQSLQLKGAKLEWTNFPVPSINFKDFIL